MSAADYDRANAPFMAVVDALTPQDWSRPSPCDGWTARDVLFHVVDTQRDVMMRAGHDLGMPPDLDDPPLGWRAHAESVARLLADPVIADQQVPAMGGTAALGEVMTRFYGFDLLVHRWDLARSAGLTADWTDAELDEIEAALDGFGEQLYGEGICRPAVPVPADAPRPDRLLARMGRDPHWGR
ncbi:MAG: TIGR03086 family protein [Austwickia sp.]|nr:TIGR03086 family protein [Austwickia sp.]